MSCIEELQWHVPIINLRISWWFRMCTTFNYYNDYPSDSIFIKSLVAIVWVIELVHTIFIDRSFYIFSINDFGTKEKILIFPFEMKFPVIWTSIAACSVQVFFAYRIRIMSAIFLTTVDIETRSIVIFENRYNWAVILVLVLDFVNDLLIAAGLSYYLSQSRSGIDKTNRILNILIKYAVRSGLITCVMRFSMLVCFVKMPHNFIWLSLFVCVAKLYANSLLAQLNARKRLRSDATNESQTIVLNTITDRERNSETDPSSSVHYSESKARPRRQIRPFEIEVRTDTIAKIDDSETTDRIKLPENL
ncbi:hypothetical protein PNOK_0762500 [Pyrrhoderma noxium]|uniref:DUF6534 domain-containing protein n=1 Tax=Pyrrhoderma noxium TaxID=2282107 RepID=A0A286UD95_9AGAM|nr:hypothetical protein PNOK_0762500 [Pyrrhoderma noxium]